MYTLYIANKNYSSWSLRPWILMTELQIPFEEKLVPFSEKMNWSNFRTFSPSGKVPCLVDNDVTVWDSLAISEYLAENHTGIWPSERKKRAWARCAAAEMHSGFNELRTVCGMNIGVRIKLNDISSLLKKDLDRINELWAEGLSMFGGPYLTGKAFTAADAFFAPVVFRMQSFGLQLNRLSESYCSHMMTLAGMIQWQEHALQEVWRDLGHEEEAAQFGQIIADYRRM